MTWVYVFLALLAVSVVTLALRARQAGPRQVSDGALERARVVVRCTADDPSPGWGELGSRTRADGLRLRFDADDDPQAEAKLLVPDPEGAGGKRFGHSLTLTLAREFETAHVHTGGYVFRVRLRGTGRTVGKQVAIKMMIGSNGVPYAGLVENDDDHDPAMGDWIEFEFAEVLRLRPNTR